MLKTFFKPVNYSTGADTALLFLRIVAGSALLLHGYGKIQNPMSWAGPESTIPGIFLLLAAISEFGGGIALVLGVLTRLASFGIACTMAVAVYFHKFVYGDPFVPTSASGAYELPLLFFAVACLFIAMGPGRFSGDRVVFK